VFSVLFFGLGILFHSKMLDNGYTVMEIKSIYR
jgi:hypothetical protein